MINPLNSRIGVTCLIIGTACMALPATLWACMWATLPLEGLEGKTLPSNKYRIIGGELYEVVDKPAYEVTAPEIPPWQTAFPNDVPLPTITSTGYNGPKIDIAAPAVGTVVVQDFFSHLPQYRPIQQDPVLAIIIHQISLRRSKLPDVEVRHYLAMKGWQGYHLLIDAYDVKGANQTRTFVKNHLDPMLKSKFNKYKDFKKWYKNQERLKDDNPRNDVSKWEDFDDDSADELTQFANDTNHSLATRMLASRHLMERFPKRGILWAQANIISESKDIAFHASWLLRPFGLVNSETLKKIHHKQLLWPNLAWAALMNRDKDDMKLVLKITGPRGERKLIRQGLSAALGDAKDAAYVSSHLDRIITTAVTQSIEGKLDIYGSVPPVYLVQCLAACPNVRIRRNSFEMIFAKKHNGRQVPGRTPLETDLQLIQFYVYGLYPNVTAKEQVDLKAWLKKDAEKFPEPTSPIHKSARRLVTKVANKKLKKAPKN